MGWWICSMCRWRRRGGTVDQDVTSQILVQRARIFLPRMARIPRKRTGQFVFIRSSRRMNSGRRGVPPQGRPAPASLASAQADARRYAHQVRFQSLVCDDALSSFATTRCPRSRRRTVRVVAFIREIRGSDRPVWFRLDRVRRYLARMRLFFELCSSSHRPRASMSGGR